MKLRNSILSFVQPCIIIIITIIPDFRLNPLILNRQIERSALLSL
jgi:hypothetical protein